MESFINAYKWACLLIAITGIILLSCNEYERSGEYKAKDRVSVIELYSNGFNSISIVTIDSVEYILCDNYKGGISITPKIKK